MAEYARIAIETEVMEEVTKLARKNTHLDELAPGRAIEWMLGEYKRLTRTAKNTENQNRTPEAAAA